MRVTSWIALFIITASASFAAPQEDFLRGTLPNGLQYIIIRHDAGSGHVEMALRMDVGALDETDDQLGYAHFLEHLAFEGSPSFPSGFWGYALTCAAMRKGLNSNAYTSVSETVYEFSSSNDKVNTGILWFSEILDELELSEAAVAHERQVILGELREDNWSSDPLVDLTLIGKRNVLGTLQSLADATPESIRAFYKKHYRPSKATLIVIGDVRPADVLKKARSKLGAASKRGGAWQRRPAVSLSAIPEVIVATLPIPGQAQFGLTLLQDHYGHGRRQRLTYELAMEVMKYRLGYALASGDLAMTDGEVDSLDQGGGLVTSVFMAHGPVENWQQMAFEWMALLNDSRQAEVTGSEMAYAVSETLLRYSEVASPFADFSDLQEQMLIGLDRGILTGNVLEEFDKISDLVDKISASEVQIMIDDMLSRSTRVLLLPPTVPHPSENALPRLEGDYIGLNNLYNATVNGRLDEILAAVPWNEPTSSEVSSTLIMEPGDDESIEFLIRFETGKFHETAGDHGSTEAAIYMLEQLQAQIDPALVDLGVYMWFEVKSTHINLWINTPVDAAEKALKVVRYLLLVANANPDDLTSWKDLRALELWGDRSGSLEMRVHEAFIDVLSADGEVRLREPTEDEIRRLTVEQVQERLRVITDRSPLGVYAFTDIDVDEVVDLLDRTFQGLSKRSGWMEIEAFHKRKSVPNAIPYRDAEGAVMVAMPLPSFSDSNEETALEVVFARLIDRIRYKEPYVYSISLDKIKAPMGYRWACFFAECDPDQAARVQAAALDALEELRLSGASKAEIRVASRMVEGDAVSRIKVGEILKGMLTPDGVTLVTTSGE